jgi:hypothetical protein
MTRYLAFALLLIAGPALAGGNYPGFELALRKLSALRGSLIPLTDATYDVGESSTPKRWRDGLFSRNVQTDTLKANTIVNEAGTGLPSATYGFTLPDNAYITSAETTNGSVVYQLNGLYGLGFSTIITSNNPMIFYNNVAQAGWYANGYTPAANGTKLNGSANLAWDDIYTDDLFLQQTTAGEARIHFEGAAGDSSMGIRAVEADGTAPTPATDAVALSFLGAANPGSGESVEMMRLTTGQILGRDGTPALPAFAKASDPDNGMYFGTNTVALSAAGTISFAVDGGKAYSYHEISIDMGGTGSESFMDMAGIAGNSTARIKMTKADGTDATPYDTFSFLLPASPASGASVEAMRVSSARVSVMGYLGHGTAEQVVTLGTTATTFDVTKSYVTVNANADDAGNISTITCTACQEGDEVTIVHVGTGDSLTYTDTASPGANQLALAGNFVNPGPDATLVLFRTSGGYWAELSRSSN